MKKFFLYSAIFLILVNNAIAGSAIDIALRKQINFFGITPIPNHVKISNRAQVLLGEKLFKSTLISGNKNISCLNCHDPKLGTSDGKILSQTHDGKGVLKRNSPSLFNTGLPSRVHMFWDGRVSFKPALHEFNTPDKNFNGPNPPRNDITKMMTSALAMQVIFPMASYEEMRGAVNENDLASAKTNLEVWDLIVSRIQNNKELNNYLINAYPNENKINIGHIGEAISQYIREVFHSNQSPFNKYLNGNDDALTMKEKNGFQIFIERGKCIACHQGGELGLNTFYASIGIPQFGAKPYQLDLGRSAVTGEDFNKMFFRVPSLLNLAVTGPYMHNGAYETIRDVINHYSNIAVFLDSFDLNLSRTQDLPVEIEILNDTKTKKEIFNSIQAPFLRRGLGFTEDEKDDLEEFLTHGLFDPYMNKIL